MKKLYSISAITASPLLLLLLWGKSLQSQNLSFTRPAPLPASANTDRAPAIVNFKGEYFIAWKEKGTPGKPAYSHLGKNYDTATIATPVIIPGAATEFSPALRVLNSRLYLMWINPDGTMSYIISNTDKSFDLEHIQTVHFTNTEKLSLGITAAAVGNNMLIAAHADNKDNMVYTLLQPSADGIFKDAGLQRIPGGKSKDYPFVISITNTTGRYCWHGKDDLIYYADYNSENATWTAARTKGEAQTQISPALFHVWDTDKLFYIWKGYKKDGRFYYKIAGWNDNPAGKTQLPDYFNSDLPVSVCKVDENNFMMAYTAGNGQLFISSFSSYPPSGWMGQYLHTKSSNKTLRDIVLPGAHDAGMSVLTATGGQQKGTINECNTLTQQLNIEQQLNGGIRMFDLRAGTFNKMLYAKHCASDCMEDAIGGGYGERLQQAATAMRNFLLKNNNELILLSFSHFCERETPMKTLKDSLLKWIGSELVYSSSGSSIGQVPLRELAGKVIISLETTGSPDRQFPSCSIAGASAAFVNFRREYAATNDIKKLVEKEKAFFVSLNNTLKENDLVRLDWQLTQSTDEAPMICNDFQDEKLSPLLNGAMLLANAVKKNKSIIGHSLDGNKYLPVKIQEWVNDGTISKNNRPNILYVDVAGAWITDFCIDLLKSDLYR